MKVDAVMVLGKELRMDPERAMRELRARSAAASVALREGAGFVATYEARLRGQERSGSAIVRELLLELGVPEERILIEDWTRCTQEEADAARALVRERGLGRLACVTSTYHVARARRYMEGGPIVVTSPETFLQRANAQEAAWIEGGTPDAATLEHEGRIEQVIDLLHATVGRIPGLEIAAAAAWRRVT